MKKTLVLNADYTPLNIVSWKTGLVQTIVESKDASYVVEYYDEWVIFDSSMREYQIPAVIALKKYADVAQKRAPYTKTNVYARDMNQCQYCGEFFKRKDLTVDHVVPKSRWKELGHKGDYSIFENVVTACGKCNTIKGDRTCKEVKMYPINEPKAITRVVAFNRKLKLESYIPEEWRPYVKGMISE